MPATSSCHSVTIEAGSKEYTDVLTLFQASCKRNIIKVELATVIFICILVSACCYGKPWVMRPITSSPIFRLRESRTQCCGRACCSRSVTWSRGTVIKTTRDDSFTAPPTTSSKPSMNTASTGATQERTVRARILIDNFIIIRILI